MPFDARLLANLGYFVAVIESGNFARAAEALALSPSGISRAITRLEARVGVRLLHRTTRSVTLTDEGQQFYTQIKPWLAGIEEAADVAASHLNLVRGRLKVNVDPFFARLVLAPHMREFVARFPDLNLELITRKDVGDFVGDGVDVAVRFGKPPASSLVARKLLETRILTVAAPSYLKKHGRPKRPEDLVGHECIQFLDPQAHRAFEWEFRRGNKAVSVATQGLLLLNNVDTMLGACLAGTGICQVMALGVSDFLDRGELVDLFPDWPDETFALYALYASRHHLPAKVRAFVDFCLEKAK
jgi:DNA-binding transcriptional LysR family regulator